MKNHIIIIIIFRRSTGGLVSLVISNTYSLKKSYFWRLFPYRRVYHHHQMRFFVFILWLLLFYIESKFSLVAKTCKDTTSSFIPLIKIFLNTQFYWNRSSNNHHRHRHRLQHRVNVTRQTPTQAIYSLISGTRPSSFRYCVLKIKQSQQQYLSLNSDI